jgi:hypothetical protein
MEFLNAEVATELGLSAEQVTAIVEKGNSYIAEKQKEWDGKANQNAESILTGAAKYAQTKFGITEERQQGEKFGDYLNRLADKGFEAKQATVTQLENEYKQKLKDFNGNDATKAELEAAKAELDRAKQVLAGFDEIKAKAERADQLQEELTGTKREVAFQNVKPNFPDTVNPYEAKAKWDEFKKGVLEKNTIELVDGVPMAIDKENNYKQAKLEDLVKADAELSALLQGRQQGGTGARAAGASTTIDGVPFEVPELAKTDTKERAKVIKEGLAKEGIAPNHKDYPSKFAEYNTKILAAKK